MKEHIYTIPINDAFDTDCECPVCHFLKNEENQLIDYTLGASMMESDARIITNENGFCKHHFARLLSCDNKLSMALVLETHLAHIREMITNDSQGVSEVKKSLFKKPVLVSDAVTEYDKISSSCVICEKLNRIEEKFIDNLFHLYKKESEFKDKFYRSKGFCVPHFSILARYADKFLSGDVYKEFLQRIYELEINHLDRVQEDISWFAKKFDFRFAAEDWKNSRDAVPRTTEKIIGYVTPTKE